MGYYLVYGFFYLISLLPWFIIYGISDIIFLLLAYVFRYRRKMMQAALQRSFPEKTQQERDRILRGFYRNFCDTWLEMIKLLSMSKKKLSQRVTADFEAFHQLKPKHSHVQLFAGHFMNWEWFQAVLPIYVPYPVKGIYMPASSKVFDKLVYNIRNRFGVQLVSSLDKQALIAELDPLPGTSFCTGVVADQSPPNLQRAFWLNFLQQPTAFLANPWERMQRLNQPIVYIDAEKKRRGRYHLQAKLLFAEPAKLAAADMTLQYAQAVEATILKQPEIYLWSHRRWKIRYNADNPVAPWIGPENNG